MQTDPNRTHQLICLAVAFFVVTLASPNLILARQQDEKSHEEKLEFVSEAARAEARNLIRQRVEHKIDFYKRQFGLENAQLRKAKIYSKSVAAKHARTFEKPIMDTLKQMLTSTEFDRFTINGTTRSFDEGVEDVEPDALDDPILTMSLGDSGQRMTIGIQTQNSSSSQMVRNLGNVKLEFESSPNWRKSLSFLTDEQFQDTEEYLSELERNNLVKALQIILSHRLDLTDEQQTLMKPWIEENAEFGRNYTFRQQLNRLQENRRIFSNMPDFLDTTQKELWQRLKNDAYPGAW